VAIEVTLAADVASTSDITEAILAQALVGKLGGADASDSSTIRSVNVVAVGRRRLRSSSSSSSINERGTNFASSFHDDVKISASSSSDSGSLQDDKPVEYLRSSRLLIESVHVNVTFEVVDSLAGLGYQNADAFEVFCLNTLNFSIRTDILIIATSRPLY
jgi:hypothetical protein